MSDRPIISDDALLNQYYLVCAQRDSTEAKLACAEKVIQAARRARASMQLLIRELTDPGSEALAAEYELGRVLAEYGEEG